MTANDFRKLALAARGHRGATSVVLRVAKMLSARRSKPPGATQLQSVC